jgi:hypothetical protein
MQLRCETRLPSDVNQFRVIFAILTMPPQESVMHLLRHFNTSKRQSEKSRIIYTLYFTVDFLLSVINKVNKPEYIVKKYIYRQEGQQKDFTNMESAYLNLDKNILITEQAKYTQTKISSLSNFVMTIPRCLCCPPPSYDCEDLARKCNVFICWFA